MAKLTQMSATSQRYISVDTRNRIAGHIEALGSPNQKAGIRAEQRLFSFGAKVVPQLIEVANSPDPQVRFRVAWVLGKSRDPAAFEALCRLADDEYPRVRYDAVLATGELGDERAAPVLKSIAALRDEEGATDSAAKAALSRLRQSRRKPLS